MGNKRNRNKKTEEVAITTSVVQSNEQEHVLHVLSNDPQTWKYDILQMLLEGVMNNLVGYMDAKNTVTGNTERLLVGLELAGDKVNAYPLARLLEPDEIANYQAPDGKGGYDGLESADIH